MQLRYVPIVLMIGFAAISQSFADTEKPQSSWKYLVKRTIKKKNNITGKKELYSTQAFVYYGKCAEKAGGQIKTVPQVVYIDKNGNRLMNARYHTTAIIPLRADEKFDLLEKLPEEMGSSPNRPASVSQIAKNFGVLPFKPEEEIKKGLIWTRRIYISFVGPYVWLPTTVRHEVTSLKWKKGRKCAVIEYSANGRFKSDEHPERHTEEERAEFRADCNFNCSGTTLYDPKEQIVIENEQTVAWKLFGEKRSRLKDGSIGWVPQQDNESTVTISVSLVPDEDPASTLQADLRKMWLEQAAKPFRPYLGNPIIRPGGMGIWDSWAVMSMSVVKVDGVFHLYYEGGLSGCGDLQIGHATSTDGLNWIKNPANPVLEPGEPGKWDDGATWDPYVIYEDGLFKMWYGGERKGRRDFQCGYAVSKDGVHFTKMRKISDFAVGDIGDMHVFHNPDNGRYYMYYWDRRFAKAESLRVAVSENETDFDFENARVIRIQGERPGHRYSHVLKEADKWYMFYGFDGQFGMGLAVSDDGFNWRAHNTKLGGGEDAEVLRVSKDLYFMFYCPEGLQDEADCNINLAIYNGSLKKLGESQ